MAYTPGLTDPQLRAAVVPVSLTGTTVTNTVAVSGTFWQATQPISGTVTVGNASLPVTGTFWQATQPVSIAGSVAVTGSFFQATQPVSIAATVPVSGPLTDTQLRAVAVPVSLASTTITNFPATQAVTGTFFQATQPVSMATAPTTPVTGTFWQATQPVSLASTTITGTVAVTGSFFQATQPVSIASMPSTPVTGTFWQATQPVSGTFFQATQPVSIAATVAVSGPLTDVQLRATPVPVSGTFTPAATPESTATFRGRASSFRTPGRAGTTGQKIFALHNATGSTRVVRINQLAVDLYQTVAKVIGTAPPIIRVHRFTALPTGGTALSKVPKDTALTSNASVTAWGDASADGTSSASALAVTIPAGNTLTQEIAARLFTAAGYEMMDRIELLENKDIVLRALEGIVIEVAYTTAVSNPTTDMWITTCDWWEV